MAVDVSRIPNNNKFDPVREAILQLQTDVQSGVSGVGSINGQDGLITIVESGNITVGTVGTTITIGIDDSTYLTEEVNDLTAAVTWANVPDANITQSSVTQHQAALSITENQISDLQSYLVASDLDDYLLLTETGEQTIAGDIVISGDLTISGTTTYINTNHLNIGDNIIQLNADIGGSTAPTEDAGFYVNRGNQPDASFLWDEDDDRFSTYSNSLQTASLYIGTNLFINTSRQVLASSTISSTVPYFTFSGDSNTGVGRATNNKVSLIAEGTKVLEASDTGVDITGTLDVSGSITGDGIVLTDEIITSADFSSTDNRFKLTLTQADAGTIEASFDDVVLSNEMETDYVPYVSVAGGNGATYTTNAVLSQSWLKFNSDTLELGTVSGFSVDSKTIKIGKQVGVNDQWITEYGAREIVSSIDSLGGSATAKIEFTTAGRIQFNDEFTFPASDGTSGQVLTTDGSGDLSWADASGGGDADTIDGFYAVDLCRNVFTDSTNDTPDTKFYIITLPFLSGSGSSSYYYFDVLGFRDIGNMSSQLHYRVYLHSRANGVNNNDLDADVLTELEQPSEFFQFAKKDGGASGSQFYIRISEDYSGIQIIAHPSQSNLTSSMITTDTAEPSGFSTVTPIKQSNKLTLDDVTDNNSATSNAITVGGLTSTGNIQANGWLQAFGFLYTRDNLRVLNAAGTDWNTWATRSNGNYNLSVGTINSGDITVNQNIASASGNPLVLSANAGANIELYSNYAVIDADSSLSIRTQAASTRFQFDVSNGLFYVYNQGNAGGIDLRNANSRIYFNGNRAIEGATDGTNLQIGEAYSNVLIPSGATLEVDDNIIANTHIYMAKGTDPRIYASSGVGLNIDGEALYLNRYSSSDISMVTGGGNVGIGTTSPSQKLQVKGNIQMGVDPTLYWESNTLKLQTSYNAIGVVQLRGSTSYAPRFEVYNANNVTKTAQIHGDGVTYFNGGNVGIGTTSPFTKTHIYDTFDPDDSYGYLLVENGNTVSGSAATNAAVNVKNYHGTSQFMQWEENGLRFGSRITANGGAGNVYITSGNDSVAMTLLSGGNVGIGTATPSAKLHVIGNITCTDQVNVSATPSNSVGVGPCVYLIGNQGASYTILQQGVDSYKHFGFNGSSWIERMSLNNTNGDFYFNGDVGIGVTSPDDKLDVDGRIRARQGFAGTDGSAKEYFWISNNTGNSGNIWRRIGTFYAGQSSRIKIEAVGVTSYGSGTIAGKTTILAQVNNNNNLEGRWFQEGLPGQQNAVYIKNVDNSTHEIYFNIGPYSEYAFEALISDGTFSTDATTVSAPTGGYSLTRQWNVNGVLWAASNDYIGIGNSSPNHTLTVNGNTESIGVQISSTDRFTMGADGTWNYIKGKSGNGFIFSTTGAGDVFTIKNDGLIGIGTTAPTNAKMVINNAYGLCTGADGMLKIKSLSTAYGSETVALQTTIDGRTDDYAVSTYGGDGRHFLVFQPDGGRVGIRRTDPTYELDVSGTIRATGDVIAYSDARVKENVKTIDNAIDKVTQLRGVSYNKIGETEEKIGVIAQEIEKVLPQVVQEDDEGMKSVAYGNIVGVLIEAIKEQQKQIDELKARLDAST